MLEEALAGGLDEELEVFENASDHGSAGTLFSIVDRCSSPFGRRKLRAWLCEPPALLDDIAEQVEEVDTKPDASAKPKSESGKPDA